MNFIKECIADIVGNSADNAEKYKTALRQMRDDIASGKLIVSPKTDDEKKQWLRERAYTERDSYNAETGKENEIDGYNCDICKNKGLIADVVEDENGCRTVYKQCKCRAVRIFIRKANASGLKDVLKKYTFSNYEIKEDWQKTVKERAMQFAKDDLHNWFFIGGQSGAGKSHLCTAICTYYLKQNKNVKYMMWRDDSNYVKSIINDSEEYQRAVQNYKKVDVLYIDDLFKMGKDQQGNVPRPTTADINLAFEILNYRYNNKGLITIISSERQLHEIVDIDTAIGGRIYEMTAEGGYAIDIKNDDKKNYRNKGIVEL